MTTVEILRRQLPVGARCHGCDVLRPEATRERVRQHVKRSGHTAEFVVEDLTIYSPREARDGS